MWNSGHLEFLEFVAKPNNKEYNNGEDGSLISEHNVCTKNDNCGHQPRYSFVKDCPYVKEVPEEQTKYSFEKQKAAFQHEYGLARKNAYVSKLKKKTITKTTISNFAHEDENSKGNGKEPSFPRCKESKKSLTLASDIRHVTSRVQNNKDKLGLALAICSKNAM